MTTECIFSKLEQKLKLFIAHSLKEERQSILKLLFDCMKKAIKSSFLYKNSSFLLSFITITCNINKCLFISFNDWNWPNDNCWAITKKVRPDRLPWEIGGYKSMNYCWVRKVQTKTVLLVSIIAVWSSINVLLLLNKTLKKWQQN